MRRHAHQCTAAGVGHLEAKIRLRRAELVAGEGNHLCGWVYAQHISARKTGRDLSSDLTVPTTNIQNMFRPLQIEQGEDFGGHRLLELRNPRVFGRIPFGHCFFEAGAIPDAQQWRTSGWRRTEALTQWSLESALSSGDR